MNTHSLFAILSLVVAASVGAAEPAPPADAVTLRVRFGMKDTEGQDWSGSVTATPGKVSEIRGWRWTPMDKAEGNSWAARTRQIPAQSSAQRERVKAGKPMPIGDNGVVITLTDTLPSSEIVITTTPGEVKFKLSDLPYGKRLLQLQGNIEIERALPAGVIANTAADEDYPAAVADNDGTVYVAYVAFTRGKDFPGTREPLATPDVKPASEALAAKARVIAQPEDFDYLAQKTGGDQVMLRVRKAGVWSEPIPVSKAGGEVYRPAIALDGAGRAWVFYSSHVGADANLDHGNWELMARCYAGGKLGKPVNVSNAAGSDFAPAAATDASGKVVVTWMGGRGQSFDIFAATQDGDTFGAPVDISAKPPAGSDEPPRCVCQQPASPVATPANEWDPAIAADKKGNVAVAWDTYEKGDHDIHLVLRDADGKFSKAMPVAATLNFEARPALAYDGQGDLWIAWEQGGENWAKDFGALKKGGIGIFHGGRTLGAKVLRNGTEWLQPPEIVVAPPAPAGKGKGKGKGKGPVARQQMAPCFPRLGTDAQGKVWLAFRGRPPGGEWRVGVGPVFCEFVTRMDGDTWLAPVWVPRSDNILDNRPAWAALPGGDMLLAYAGDGRAAVHPPYGGGKGAGRKSAAVSGVAPDPNNTIFAATVSRADAVAAPKLAVIAAEKPATPPAAVAEELAAIKTLRDYRVKLGSGTLRLWRGEFHRHTELSPDGGGDGALLDMWRYALDASYMDWIGNGDHDNGNGREYSWWTTQKTTALFTLPGVFVPMYSYERSVSYPEGHRNPVFAKRGIRTLPRLPISDAKLENPPPAPDTELLYKYLRRFDGVCAEHTSATDMGTDWRNNDPVVEPFVEIYQGARNNYERPDAPRSAISESKVKMTAVEGESLGGWRPKGMVNLALKKGYRLAFQSSSDHGSTHMSYCNVFITEPTREAILDGMKKRRVYAATDHILADMRCVADGKEHFMGEEFTSGKPPTLKIKFAGHKPIARVTIVKNDEVVHTIEPNQKEVDFNWTDTKAAQGQTSYYYVRAEQVADVEGAAGEIAWISPMWIKYQP